MGTCKVNVANLIEYISNLFKIDITGVKCTQKNSFFSTNFVYNNIIVHIFTYEDRSHDYYQEIEIKKESIEFEYEWTPYNMLLAYYDNEKFNFKFDYNYLLTCISKLKEYIDNNKVFFEFYKKDYSARFFAIDGIVKEMPLRINLANETILRFGKNAYKIENNR